MAPPAGIASTEHLDRLVKDSAKLVIHCFTTGKDDHSDSDNGGGGEFAQVAKAFDELSNTLDASSSDVKSYRVDASSRPDVAAGLPVAGGGEAGGGGDDVSASRWVFFNAGKMVRAYMYWYVIRGIASLEITSAAVPAVQQVPGTQQQLY